MVVSETYELSSKCDTHRPASLNSGCHLSHGVVVIPFVNITGKLVHLQGVIFILSNFESLVASSFHCLRKRLSQLLVLKSNCHRVEVQFFIVIISSLSYAYICRTPMTIVMDTGVQLVTAIAATRNDA